MLVNFRFKNFRSFYNENSICMVAQKDKQFKEINTFLVEDIELLKSISIFGPNAFGKSNVIKALAYMKNIVLNSSSQIPINNDDNTFAFYTASINAPSLFEIEFIQNNTYYRYGFILEGQNIKEEWLDTKKDKFTNIFKRKDNKLNINGIDENITKLINPTSNSLFVSLGTNLNLEVIAKSFQDVINWFNNLLIVLEEDLNSLDIYSMSNGKYIEKALKILNNANIGIKDFEVIKENSNSLSNIDLSIKYNVYDETTKKVVGSKEILLCKNAGFNSKGTIKLLLNLSWILKSLDCGSVVLIDDIDSKLDILLVSYLMGLFNSIDNNPKNAQLICAAHNVMLMDNNLRRDQIYITSKDEFGESSLITLDNFKHKTDRDVYSKKYLAGFYSKLPDIKKEI